MCSRGASAPSPAQQHNLERLEQDQEIEADGHVLDVKEIVSEFVAVVLEGREVASLRLRPAGSARLDRPALRVQRNLSREVQLLIGNKRARPDEIHLAEQNIVELRKLVQTALAQPTADASDSLIVLLHGQRIAARIGVHVHGSE